MPPEERDAALLWDMLEAARVVQHMCAGKTFADYERSRMLQLAVERAIEIIGEAARKVSAPFQIAHREISWRPIIAQRHVLAHEYGEIKQERIWRVATTNVPELIQMLERLLPPEVTEQ